MTHHAADSASPSFARFDGWWRITPWLMFLAALAARFAYVSVYAGSLPYWDQWDGEADRLLLPWLNGTWHWMDLFSPHNEHRIALTRLLTLALFELNHHQWDNLVEAYACAGVFAAMEALLYARLCRGLPHLSQRLGLLVFMTVLAALPFAWENIASGFQSAFYFMALVAIAMQSVAAFGKGSGRDIGLLLAFGIMSLFTMASGLIACLAVIVVVVVRNRSQKPASAYFAPCVFVCMALIALVGLVFTPAIPYHESLKAHGLAEHVRSLLINLAWPWQPSTSRRWWLLMVVLWLPTLVWIVRVLRGRNLCPADAFAAGMLTWVGLQFLAIAHSRGHDMSALSSRYMDIPAMAMALNAYLALVQLATTNKRLVSWTIATLFFAATLAGLHRRQGSDMSSLVQRHALTVNETRHVRDYLATGNPVVLQQPPLYIPYPDATRLQSLLDNLTIRAMLPRLTHQDYYSTQGLGWLSIVAMKWQAPFARSSNYPPTSANALQQTFSSLALHPSCELEPAVTVLVPRAAPVPIPASQLAFLPNDESDRTPLILNAGQTAFGSIHAPRAGRIVAFEVVVGTYFNTSNGSLQLTLCKGRQCASGSGDLQTSLDNSLFMIAVTPTLDVSAGDDLTYRLSKDGGSVGVALWLYPSVAGGPQKISLEDGQTFGGQTAKFALSYAK
ncbi:hypothetical protein [Dyella psychrodurans]|uniref:Glycosyltransferase RgtA/B/C/D-like domain-containing protein n=1 Tax=Dyella psychrodurans TaxID=1927960 RepID=A0A370WUH4_9GAMM|nr:hypothetical protein [Dyella psychrodurans]RDS79793.1 hypothetical protein DWU99_20565 [Dyella psychrodurans]